MPPFSLLHNLSSPSKLLQTFLVVLACAISLEYHIGRLALGSDHLLQYSASKQLVDGNGLSIPVLNGNDISAETFRPLKEFPPGLSIITAPIFMFTDDVRFVHLSVALLNLLIFLLLSFRLIRVLDTDNQLTKWLPLAFLFASVNGIFLYKTNSTDMVCVNLFIGAALLLVKYYRDKKRIVFLAISCWLLAMCVYFRYAYLPAVLALPSYFLIRSIFFQTKEWKEMLHSIWLTALTGLPFFAHIFLINSKTGYIASKGQNSEGILYWENISRLSPFPLETFFDIFPMLKLMGFYSEYGYDRGYEYPYFIHLGFFFVSILILFPIMAYAWRNVKRIKKTNVTFIFFGIGTILSLGLVALVLIGSVINPSYHDAYIWSWSMIFRYYLVPAFLIQFAYFLIVVKAQKAYLRKWALGLITISFVYAAVLKSYNYTANYKAFNFNHNTALLKPNNSLLNTYQLHKFIPNEDGSRKLILIDKMVENQFIYSGAMLGIKNFVATKIGMDNPLKKVKTSTEQKTYLVTNRPWDELNIGMMQDNEAFAKLDNGIMVYRCTIFPD